MRTDVIINHANQIVSLSESFGKERVSWAEYASLVTRLACEIIDTVGEPLQIAAAKAARESDSHNTSVCGQAPAAGTGTQDSVVGTKSKGG